MFFSCYTFELQISKAFQKSDKLVAKQKYHRDITYLTGPLPVIIIRAYTCNQAAFFWGLILQPCLQPATELVQLITQTVYLNRIHTYNKHTCMKGDHWDGQPITYQR